MFRGDASNAQDLERAEIPESAEAALVFPSNSSNEADMKSILTVMAIETIAPDVRTVVEVNNPRHVEHFKRAHADEIVVTPRLASHLVARAALYPGLSDLIADMVSGGAGSELYRVKIPDDYHGLAIDEVSRRFRDEHHATLLAVNRLGATYINPSQDFQLMGGDEALIVADRLGESKPVHHFTGPIDESTRLRSRLPVTRLPDGSPPRGIKRPALTGGPCSSTSDYLISTLAPCSSRAALILSASSLETASLTGLGAASTRSLASLRPRPVSSRTTLMTGTCSGRSRSASR